MTSDMSCIISCIRSEKCLYPCHPTSCSIFSARSIRIFPDPALFWARTSTSPHGKKARIGLRLPDSRSGKPRKTPGFGCDPGVFNTRFFWENIPISLPNFDPPIWVSFGFGHTLGRLKGDLPRKGPWRPANEEVGIGRFFGPGLPGKRGFGGGFPRRRVVRRDGGPGDPPETKNIETKAAETGTR